MKTILFTLSAIVALLVPFASEGLAAPNSTNSGHATSNSHSAKTMSSNGKTINNAGMSNHGNVSNYHQTNGTKFAQGYFYKGKQHTHWTSHRWDSRYGCECYFDPCCNCWYYWCQPASCYYPVTYCPYQTYCWTLVVRTPCVPCATCTSSTQPISVQTQTITRTIYATTTVCTQPPVPVANGNTYNPGAPSNGLPNGGAQASNIPPIPAPLAAQ
jgi:hypothetical protein